MPSLEDEAFDTKPNLVMLAKLASIQTKLLVPRCAPSAQDARARYERDPDATEEDSTDDEDVSLVPRSDDPLGSRMAEAINGFNTTTREGQHEVDIVPSASIDFLFANDSKPLKARLILASDLSDDLACSRRGARGANFGMERHQYRETGQTRTLMYVAIENVQLSHSNQKLRLGPANRVILEELCTRAGLTARTAHKVYPRC